MITRELFRGMLRAMAAFASALLGLDPDMALTRRGLCMVMRETRAETVERERRMRLAA